MSLDNVLAVAGAAKGNTIVLVIGLAFAVVMMAVAASYIAFQLARYPWISWLGLAVIVFVAFDMIWDGSQEVACYALRGTVRCSDGLAPLLREWLALS